MPNRQKVDIIYLYEKAHRELDLACAVKFMAEKLYGLRLEIIQQNYGYIEAFQKYVPRVVVLPFCYQERSHNIYLWQWRKAVYFNLTWEQLFYPGNRTAKTPRGEFACNHVIHHAWGDFYADFLRKQNIPEKFIFVNGNPVYTLYDEPYRNYFQGRDMLASLYGLDPDKRWIFFPENYNWAFYDESMLKQMIRDGQPAEQVHSMREFSLRSFEAVIKWCSKLNEYDDIELIIRPRPATILTDFQDRVQNILGPINNRMRIIPNETVREWIMASQLVISSYSTSLIEAAIAGKSSYMLEPLPLPGSLYQNWHELITHISTESQFLDVCHHGTYNEENNKLGNWARSAMMSRGDSIRNIVDYLVKICQGLVPLPSKPPARSILLPGTYPPELPLMLAPLYQRLRHRKINQSHAIEVHPEYQDDVTLLSDIPRRLKKWEEILGDCA